MLVECCDNMKFLTKIKSESVSLVVTSPPYNIGKEYEHRTKLSDWIDGQHEVISECHRVLKASGSICWQTGNYICDGEVVPLDITIYPLFTALWMKLRNRIVWKFGHGLHCKKRFSGRHETILWFTKGDDYSFDLDPVRVPQKYPTKRYYKGARKGQLSCNPLGCNPGDVWEIPNVKNNHPEKTDHPCQFPVELVERLVLSLTKRGDTVLDPYMGVGSSVIAAEKHERIGIGCDNVNSYVEIAKDRLKKLASGELVLRPMGKPLYVP